MLYCKMTGSDVDALGNYLGIALEEWDSRGVRKRDCANCRSFDHNWGGPPHSVMHHGEMLEVNSTNCGKIFWRCPGCTHGNACGEYVDGIFLKQFVTPGPSIWTRRVRRFINLKEFADRIGAHPNSIRRWISAGSLDGQGLVRGGTHYFIDTKKCPLLKKRSNVRAKIAA